MTNFCESEEQENGFLQLFSVANVENASEAFSVLFHTCMLDIGFLSVNVSENNLYKCLPEGWRASGALKFHYSHNTCHDSFCWMTCIPLYSDIAIHGVLDNGGSDSIYMKLKIAKYLKDQTNFKDAENIFVGVKELVRRFKDEFCYPLLALLQERAGCEPSFGFSITVDEIKFDILKLLPVESIISLSSVNRDFNRVANSPLLWKNLVQRDFGLIDGPSNSSEGSYKELYRREYVKRKQRSRRRLPFSDPYYFPSILLPDPSVYIDPRIDLDPAIQQAFPHLRDRFRPNWLFPDYNFPGRFM